MKNLGHRFTKKLVAMEPAETLGNSWFEITVDNGRPWPTAAAVAAVLNRPIVVGYCMGRTDTKTIKGFWFFKTDSPAADVKKVVLDIKELGAVLRKFSYQEAWDLVTKTPDHPSDAYLKEYLSRALKIKEKAVHWEDNIPIKRLKAYHNEVKNKTFFLCL